MKFLHFHLWLALMILLPVHSTSSWAISPEEMLGNPTLEQRARDISAQLRCLVCENQSIDDSDAPLAKDLRAEVRRLISQKLADQEVLASLRQQYGDYILLNPPVNPHTWVLWFAPLMIVLIGTGALLQQYRRKQNPKVVPDNITDIPLPRAEIFAIKRPLSVVIIIVLIFSGGLYGLLGSPRLADQPIATRQQEIAKIQQASQQRVQQQRQNLQKSLVIAEAHPNDVDAWLNVVKNAQTSKAWNVALTAARKIQKLQTSNPNWWVLEAEILSRAADGQITLPVRQLLQQALAVDANIPQARNMLAVAAFQDQQYARAIALWLDILQNPMLTTAQHQNIANNIHLASIEGSLPMPELPDFSATPADITAMIESLALRLQQEPDDDAGWEKLARLYHALQQPVKMLHALSQVARLQTSTFEAQVAFLESWLLLGKDNNDLTEPLLAVARMQAIDDQHPRYLFFAGHMAKLQGNSITAKKFWNALLTQLPERSDIYTVLQQHITMLEP